MVILTSDSGMDLEQALEESNQPFQHMGLGGSQQRGDHLDEMVLARDSRVRASLQRTIQRLGTSFAEALPDREGAYLKGEIMLQGEPFFALYDRVDRELIRQATNGGPATMNDFVIHYSPRVRTWIKRILNGGVRRVLLNYEADDLVNEGLLALVNALLRYDPSRPFLPYARTVVGNTVLKLATREQSGLRDIRKTDHLERPLRRGNDKDDTVRLYDVLSIDGPSPEEAVQRDDDRYMLGALRAGTLLGSEEQIILALVLRDYSPKEIASITGKSPHNVVVTRGNVLGKLHAFAASADEYSLLTKKDLVDRCAELLATQPQRLRTLASPRLQRMLGYPLPSRTARNEFLATHAPQLLPWDIKRADELTEQELRQYIGWVLHNHDSYIVSGNLIMKDHYLYQAAAYCGIATVRRATEFFYAPLIERLQLTPEFNTLLTTWNIRAEDIPFLLAYITRNDRRLFEEKTTDPLPLSQVDEVLTHAHLTPRELSMLQYRLAGGRRTSTETQAHWMFSAVVNKLRLTAMKLYKASYHTQVQRMAPEERIAVEQEEHARLERNSQKAFVVDNILRYRLWCTANGLIQRYGLSYFLKHPGEFSRAFHMGHCLQAEFGSTAEVMSFATGLPLALFSFSRRRDPEDMPGPRLLEAWHYMIEREYLLKPDQQIVKQYNLEDIISVRYGNSIARVHHAYETQFLGLSDEERYNRALFIEVFKEGKQQGASRYGFTEKQIHGLDRAAVYQEAGLLSFKVPVEDLYKGPVPLCREERMAWIMEHVVRGEALHSISVTSGIPLPTMKTNLARAREHLRPVLAALRRSIPTPEYTGLILNGETLYQGYCRTFNIKAA